ncbi:MAG: glycosyltransferase family 4 protein [Verrucomicrobiota bacterium]|nr:glycosyltransferase family 4 protein [Verrucomicrobiota bacterium]
MKVLLSAKACNPYLGSESYFGWSAVKCLAQDHELWVLTGERNRTDLNKAQAEGLVPPNVHFIHIGQFKEWHPNPLLARMQDWREYLRFLDASLEVAKQWHAKENFDLVHHVTFTAWRVMSPLWQLGIPFVLGPICGDESFPFRLFPLLSPAGAAFEVARKASNVLSRFSPGVRHGIRAASHVFAITPEAERLIGALRGSQEGISTLSSGFYSDQKAAEFARFAAKKNANGRLLLYAAGNLGGQKCVALAFQALARVKQRGVDFRYHLGSGGPEVAHLKKLAARLKLDREIIFGGSMKRSDYQQLLGDTHIYLLPSMRETVGLTMLEAMLAGCVPIVADSGGPRITVTEDCGYKIPVSNSSRIAEEIANIIITIDRNRQIVLDKGAKASNRIIERFTEAHYRRTVNAVYQAATKSGRVTSPNV